MNEKAEITSRIQNLLKHINMNLRKVMNEELSKFKLTPHQLYILILIQSNPLINYKTLGEELCLAKSSISITIAKLISDGYLYSKKSPDDQRIKFLYLTEFGERIINEAKLNRQKMFSELVGTLTTQELEKIEASLNKLKVTIDILNK